MKWKQKAFWLICGLLTTSVIAVSLVACSLNFHRLDLVNKVRYNNKVYGLEVVDWNKTNNLAHYNLLVDPQAVNQQAFQKVLAQHVQDNKFANENISVINNQTELNALLINKNKLQAKIQEQLQAVDFTKEAILVVKNITTQFNKAPGFDLNGYFLHDFLIENNQLFLQLREYNRKNNYGAKVDWQVQRTYFLIISKQTANQINAQTKLLYQIIN